MKLIETQLPDAPIVIEMLSDLHIGSPKCDIQMIQNRIKRIEETDNTYCMIVGDIINNSTKNSVGDTYTEDLTPMQQVQMAVKLFEPIKDKIIAVTSGNHERRSYKYDGVDLIYFMCAELGISDKYDYVGTLNFLSFAGRHWLPTIYMTHGDGSSGRTVGGKANGLQRRGDIIDADVIVAGHTHMPFVFRDATFKVDKSHRCIRKQETLYVNCSATLEYESYAELMGLPPSSTASPRLIINPEQRAIAALM